MCYERQRFHLVADGKTATKEKAEKKTERIEEGQKTKRAKEVEKSFRERVDD